MKYEEKYEGNKEIRTLRLDCNDVTIKSTLMNSTINWILYLLI